jgi:hypothetical protein
MTWCVTWCVTLCWRWGHGGGSGGGGGGGVGSGVTSAQTFDLLNLAPALWGHGRGGASGPTEVGVGPGRKRSMLKTTSYRRVAFQIALSRNEGWRMCR